MVAPEPTVPMREYFERLLQEHEERHERDHAANTRAIEEARIRVDGRLEQLNHLRSEVERDRSMYVTREIFDAKDRTSDEEHLRMQEELDRLSKQLANITGRQTVYTVIIGALLVIIPLIVEYFAKR